ncbi:hypothetical protein NE664_07190 [Anaerotignum faecicola]|nr:hypothetical protein [Anaerotignum faecicola]
MKKYEYKFVSFKIPSGFDYEKKVKKLEFYWNELGMQGWKYCREGNGFTVFMRELER